MNLAIIASDNAFLSDYWKAIAWTNAEFIVSRILKKILKEIFIKFFFKNK